MNQRKKPEDIKALEDRREDEACRVRRLEYRVAFVRNAGYVLAGVVAVACFFLVVYTSFKFGLWKGLPWNQ